MDMDIDSNKEISKNIDIDKISNRLEFDISNRAILNCSLLTKNVVNFRGQILRKSFTFHISFQSIANTIDPSMSAIS